MFKHLFTLLSNDAVVDNEENTLSIFNVIDNINVSAEDIAPADAKINDQTNTLLSIVITLVSGWYIDKPSANERKLDIIKAVYDDNNQKIAEIVTPFTLPPNQQRFNLREKLNGFPINGYGSYTFKVTIREKAKIIAESEYPINVVAQKKENDT